MAQRRKRNRDYKNLELTFKKTGEKKQVKLIGESRSGESLRVIFEDNSTGYIQKQKLEKITEL